MYRRQKAEPLPASPQKRWLWGQSDHCVALLALAMLNLAAWQVCFVAHSETYQYPGQTDWILEAQSEPSFTNDFEETTDSKLWVGERSEWTRAKFTSVSQWNEHWGAGCTDSLPVKNVVRSSPKHDFIFFIHNFSTAWYWTWFVQNRLFIIL